MSLLSLIQAAASRCNLAVPANAIGNADINIQQMVVLANDIGQYLASRYNWKELRQEATITGDGSTTKFSVEGGFSRMVPSARAPHGQIYSSLYPYLPLNGPINDEDWRQLHMVPVLIVPEVWRLGAGFIEFYPAPASGENIVFDFYTSNWVLSQTIPYASYQLDTDTCVFDETLMSLGVTWKWKRTKGLDYGQEANDYDDRLNMLIGQNGSAREIAIGSPGIVPDNWFPGSITFVPQ